MHLELVLLVLAIFSAGSQCDLYWPWVKTMVPSELVNTQKAFQKITVGHKKATSSLLSHQLKKPFVERVEGKGWGSTN